MQGTMDIVALLQQNNVAKKKPNIPDFGRSSERSSFKRELAEARSSTEMKLQYGAENIRRRENEAGDSKAERLAKAMSRGKLQADKLQNSTKEEIPQAEDIKESVGMKEAGKTQKKPETLEEAKGKDAVLDTETELTELMESAEALMQQLIKLLSGSEAGETADQDLQKTTESLKAITEKLEQLLSQSLALNPSTEQDVISELKLDIQQLMDQLRSGMDGMEQQEGTLASNLQQKVSVLQTLISKMNAIKPEIHVKLTEAATQSENRVITAEAANLQTKEAEKTDASEVQLKAEGESAPAKAPEEAAAKQNDDKENEQDKNKEAAYKTGKDSSKYAAVDKPDTGSKNDFIPQLRENGSFQVNLKEINLNVKKEALVSVQKSDIINQVVKKADIIVREGHSEMIMKLEPESLGKLNLKIVVEKGLVTAKFIAESQQVKEVLESSFNQLKDALQEKGISVQNFSVSVGQQSGDSSQSQSFNQWKQSIKSKNKNIGEYLEMEEQTAMAENPYNYHEGRFDYKA